MLTCTFGPVPSHSSLYSPGLSALPSTVTLSCNRRVILFDSLANALAAKRRPPARSVEPIFNTFMYCSFFLFRRLRMQDTTCRVRGRFLYSPVIWLDGCGRDRFQNIHCKNAKSVKAAVRFFACNGRTRRGISGGTLSEWFWSCAACNPSGDTGPNYKVW